MELVYHQIYNSINIAVYLVLLTLSLTTTNMHLVMVILVERGRLRHQTMWVYNWENIQKYNLFVMSSRTSCDNTCLSPAFIHSFASQGRITFADWLGRGPRSDATSHPYVLCKHKHKVSFTSRASDEHIILIYFSPALKLFNDAIKRQSKKGGGAAHSKSLCWRVLFGHFSSF